MMYEEVIRDFAERTKTNLLAVEKLQESGDEVFEVTQLVNSMLGLLVFPQQEYVEQIPATPLQELEEKGWPIPKICGEFQQVPNLNELIRYLRNAIAHFNIEFIGDGQNEIRLLRVWNTWNKKKTWEAVLSAEDLRQLTNCFLSLLLEKKDENT